MKQLEEYREEIDKIDIKIIGLLKDRFNIVKKIGNYKKEKGIPVLDKTRESVKINSLLKTINEVDISKSFIKKMWALIFKEARKIEL